MCHADRISKRFIQVATASNEKLNWTQNKSLLYLAHFAIAGNKIKLHVRNLATDCYTLLGKELEWSDQLNRNTSQKNLTYRSAYLHLCTVFIKVNGFIARWGDQS